MVFGPKASIFDVTAPLAPSTPVWPGDDAVEFAGSLRIANGAPCNVSRLSCSTHAGTHVDAPWHFQEDGARLNDIPAQRWIGPCHLIDVPLGNLRIDADDLEQANIPAGVDRLIVRTRRQPLPTDAPFDVAYAALTLDAAGWLLEQGLILIGIDTPSVEPFDVIEHEVHHKLLGAGVLIVEGLELSATPPGPYLMICLPLRLMDADGSPARVLLVRDPS